MKIVICDDNPIETAFYRSELVKLGEENGITLDVITYISGKQMLFELEDQKIPPDIIYLDINMPGINGIETAYALRETGYHGEIIFLTYSHDHILDGYDVEALHYVIKEVTPIKKRTEILLKAVKRCSKKKQEVLTFSCAGESRTIAIEDITYFKVDRQIITVFYNDENFEFYTSLGKLENSLWGKGFLRIHRNCLVSERKIKSMVYGEIELFDGTLLQVGKTYNKVVKEELAKQKII